MKKVWHFAIPSVLLLIFMLLIWVQPIKNMLYLDDVRLDELQKYRIENVNDIEKLDKISERLPGNISRSGWGLVLGDDINIQVSYDYYIGNNYDLFKLEQFWQNDREKILLFNATTYLILIPNAQKITITLDIPNKQKFEVTRDDLENFYGRNLNEYYENGSLWEKEIIKESINYPKKLNTFFQTNKIIVLD